MKQKELEMELQKIPGVPEPSPSLEQYGTPSGIAADMLFGAYDDIYGKHVIDLGCGTGIFSIGSALIGARKVTGIDIDDVAVSIAEMQAERLGLENVSFLVEDVRNVIPENLMSDVVITNPPFGSQLGNRRADRIFLEKGMKMAPVVYSIHLESTIPFIERLVAALGGEITSSRNYPFPIKRMFPFHKKKIAVYNVRFIRITGLQK